ncbi:MAG: transposase, partial [Gemmatimonadales bacterium]
QRLGSFHELEARLRIPGCWEAWVGPRKPSADTLGYSLERFDLDGPRAMLAGVGRAMKRKKVFRRLHADPHWVAAVDGVETGKSRKRCCEDCCTREIKVGGEAVIEYYHREVVLQMVGVVPALPLDAEPIRKGETEVAAALRLLQRVKAALPRFIDVLTFDAFYLQAPFLREVLDLGYGAVVVLKQEQRDLYQDADGLFRGIQPQSVASVDGPVQVWDVRGLTSWSQLGRPVRVVREVRKAVRRERVAGKWVEREVEQDWRSVVVFPDAQQPSADLVRLWPHARWDEETRGFGELTQHWHLDHSYHHHPTARLACLLILFLAFVLTTIFFTRNLKPQARRGTSRLHLAHRLNDDLVRGGAASFWTQPP